MAGKQHQAHAESQEAKDTPADSEISPLRSLQKDFERIATPLDRQCPRGTAGTIAYYGKPYRAGKASPIFHTQRVPSVNRLPEMPFRAFRRRSKNVHGGIGFRQPPSLEICIGRVQNFLALCRHCYLVRQLSLFLKVAIR